MASVQCHKPANETSQQKCSNPSLGQKLSEITSGWFRGNNHGTSNHETHCTQETTALEAKPLHSHTTQSQSVDKTKGGHHHRASNGVACQGKTVKKKNLFQKIKDGFSSDSSGSDSESDNEGCHKRKN